MTAAKGPSATPAAALEDLLNAPLGLRERKKLKTRRALRAAAFRLFRQQGWEATTVDQIAAEAEVSPSTFFRYFPTKEDLVITDDYDPLIEAALAERPADEPLLESVRAAMIAPLRSIMAVERDELLLRMRLLNEVPSVRARSYVEQGRTRRMLVRLLAERAGGDPDDLELRAVVGALIGASEAVVTWWAEHGGTEDLADLLDRGMLEVQRAFTAG